MYHHFEVVDGLDQTGSASPTGLTHDPTHFRVRLAALDIQLFGNENKTHSVNGLGLG